MGKSFFLRVSFIIFILILLLLIIFDLNKNNNELIKEKKEIVQEEYFNYLIEKNVPTNPSKWSYYKSQAKKKFDVYPSAYANAWAAKMYKKAGGGYR